MIGLLGFGSGFDYVPKVSVTLVFDKEETERIVKVLCEKYNQDPLVRLEDLLEIAIRREARPTKVSLVGLDVHKQVNEW